MKNHLEHFESLALKNETLARQHSYYYGQIATWLRYVIPQGSRVVELGCSDGSMLDRLKPSHGVGIDFSQGYIRMARERYPNQQFVLADVTKDLPPIEAHADYVYAIDLVGYLQDIQGALEHVSKLCSPKTRLVLTKTNPFWGPIFRVGSWFGLSQPRRYSNWLTQKQCRSVIELAGFEVVRQDKFLMIPFYIPLISTLFNKYISHLPLLKHMSLVEYFICRPRPTGAVTAPSVSVIIPARNERGNMRPALERMPRFTGALEVIFVEGHSKDGTWEEIEALMKERDWGFPIKAYKQTGKGKGDAVRLGFDKAENDLLMILDADLTVQPEELPRFYQVLADRRAEYVHGTRLIYPMEDEAMRPLNWLGNKFFSATLTFLLGQTMSDTLCGTKCMWREAYLRLAAGRSYFGEFDPFGDFDLIFGSSKLSLKIVEIPVHYKSRTYGETQIRRFRDGLLLLQMCGFAADKMLFL